MSNPDISPATLPPMLYPDDNARARKTDPLSSHNAADRTATAREHSWVSIERALAAKSPMTAMGIWQFIIVQYGQWISQSRVTTGCTELARMGVIVKAGWGLNPSGYKAQAWALAGGNA